MPPRLRGPLVVLALLAALSAARVDGDGASLAVRITSPLGRTGEPGSVRIVAQVAASDAPVGAVRFSVNGIIVGEDREGPVYAVEWTDDNPFEPTEIAAEAIDAAGASARDVVTLPPFEFVESAQVSSVLLEATVQDASGRYVDGLPRDAFRLSENGAPQALDVVRPETMPATYALVVDASQSVAHRVAFIREAAGRLADFMRPGDRMLVVPFSTRLGAVTGPSTDRATLTQAVEAIEPRGGTAILDAVVSASQLLARAEGRRILVLVTDGYDQHSTLTYEDALAAVQRSGAVVFAIGVGGVAGVSSQGERVLRRLCAATGGRSFFPWSERELAGVHDGIASNVGKRYLITYTPTNQRIDGAWREIALTSTTAAHVVRTKPGYFAPKPPPVRPLLEFTVTSDRHQHVLIGRDDLRVVEDGVEQTIDTFHEATSPVSILLLLDESGSMRKAAEAAVAAARSFVESLRAEDRVGVLRFSESALLAQDLALERSPVFQAIGEYAPRGGTALYDAMQRALSRLGGVEGRRAIVIVTDGRDENNAGTGPGSRASLDEVMSDLQESGAIVFPIGLGGNVDRAVLERFATESGGEAYFPKNVESLAGDYARVVENLRRRYTIGYTSTNPVRDGAWRRVEIGVRAGGARVASRGGYSAPAQ